MAAGARDAGSRRPRLLVTGFGPFPGAPLNPTEGLVEALMAEREGFRAACDLRAEVFDVDYRTLPARLERIGAAFSPDIAVHFGLSGEATGFRLERRAKNAVAEGKPDNAGFLPPDRRICEGEAEIAATLPLGAIFDALSARGLPVGFSDDAGGYLCNYLFYLSRAGLRPDFAPAMAGFIHVPPADRMPAGDLVEGARVVLAACLAAWAPTGSPSR